MPETEHRVRGDGFGSFASAIPVSVWGRSDEPMHAVIRGSSNEPVHAVVRGHTGGAIQVGNVPVTATVNGGSTPVAATVHVGNQGGNPLKAVVSGPAGPIDAAVSVSGNVTANVGGSGAPIKLDLIKLDFGQLRLTPNIKIRFLLFGFIPLFTTIIEGDAGLGP